MLPEKKMQVTVAADSKEGLKEGLSKAEQIMKAKMGSMAAEDGGIAQKEAREAVTGVKHDKEKNKELKCGTCGKAPCNC